MSRIKELSAATPSKNDVFVFDGNGGTHKVALPALLDAVIGKTDISSAGFHNSIYRGKDITSYFTDGTLYQRIAGTNGFKPFEDLFVGDYFKMPYKITAPNAGGTGTDIVKIAGFNLHWNNYGQLRKNHVTLIPATHFGSDVVMNDEYSTAGAYKGSKMNTTTIGAVATSGNANGTINQQLYNVFGTHLQTVKELLSSAMDEARYNRFGQATGASSNWDWTDVQAVLMSEVEVYGATVWSSSGYDTGTAKSQLPIFRLNTNDMIPDGVYYWLKDVASAVYFCLADSDGYAYYGGAYYEKYVRPRFIIA